nr:MAG TPA: hypothetical protein [Caudoviricetes sp.]
MFGDVILSAVVHPDCFISSRFVYYVSVIQFLCYICVLWCSGGLSHFYRCL